MSMATAYERAGMNDSAALEAARKKRDAASDKLAAAQSEFSEWQAEVSRLESAWVKRYFKNVSK